MILEFKIRILSFIVRLVKKSVLKIILKYFYSEIKHCEDKIWNIQYNYTDSNLDIYCTINDNDEYTEDTLLITEIKTHTMFKSFCDFTIHIFYKSDELRRNHKIILRDDAEVLASQIKGYTYIIP